jgi:hypothetical protein
MILDAKLVCPKCGCESAWKSFQAPEEIMEISRLAAQFGKNWQWVEEYLHCFRSEFDKPIKPQKMKIILEELLRFVEQSGFNIDKQWHSIRPDALFAACRYVAMLNKTAFKNHNYLKKVAIDFNLKMIQKEDKEVAHKERELMDRTQRDPRGPQKIKEIMEGLK